MSIQLLTTRPDARVLQAGPIIIIHYFGAATVRSVNDDFNRAMPIIEQYGEVSYLVAMEAHLVGRPRPSVLAAVEEQLKAMGAQCRASAMVVRGSGIAPTMMRTVLTGAAFIAGDAKRRKVFRDVREGLFWLQTFDNQHPMATVVTAGEIEAVLKLPEQLSI